VSVEAHEGKSLAALLTPGLRQILFSLDRIENAKDMAKLGLRVLKSFVGSLGIRINDVDVGLTIEPERGVADSGDLELILQSCFWRSERRQKRPKRPWRF